ncbi:MAG TPA: flavin reductase family protein [Acidimicrobiales bacterium]|nr:flavin reductase family protein [Acidimicrobiales bacterium]
MTDARRQVIGPIPQGRDPQSFDRLRRRILWSLPTGLYVLGSRAGSRRNLMTISWVMQVATEPKMVAVAVESTSVTHGLVSEGGTFALSLLPRSERHLVRRFVKPVEDVDVDEASAAGTIEGEQVRLAPGGEPVLSAAVGWLWCTVRQRVVLGSHTLFVGEVADCGLGMPTVALQPAGSGTRGVDDERDGLPADRATRLDLLRMEDTRMNYGG